MRGGIRGAWAGGSGVILVATLLFLVAAVPAAAEIGLYQHTIRVVWDRGGNWCHEDLGEDVPLSGIPVEIHRPYSATAELELREELRASLTYGFRTAVGAKAEFLGVYAESEAYAEAKVEASVSISATQGLHFQRIGTTRVRIGVTDENGEFTFVSRFSDLSLLYSVVIPPGFSERSRDDERCLGTWGPNEDGTGTVCSGSIDDCRNYPEGGRATGEIDGIATAGLTVVYLGAVGEPPLKTVSMSCISRQPDGSATHQACALDVHVTRTNDLGVSETFTISVGDGQTLDEELVQQGQYPNTDTFSFGVELKDERFALISAPTGRYLNLDGVHFRFEIAEAEDLPIVEAKDADAYLTTDVDSLSDLGEELKRIGHLDADATLDSEGGDFVQDHLGVARLRIRFDRPFAFDAARMLDITTRPQSVFIEAVYQEPAGVSDEYTVWVLTINPGELGVRVGDAFTRAPDEERLWISAPTLDMLFANDFSGGRQVWDNDYTLWTLVDPLRPVLEDRAQITSVMPITYYEYRPAYLGDRIAVCLSATDDTIAVGSEGVPYPRAWVNGREKVLTKDSAQHSDGRWWWRAFFPVRPTDRSGRIDVSVQFFDTEACELVYIADTTSIPVHVSAPVFSDPDSLGEVTIVGPGGRTMVSTGDVVTLTIIPDTAPDETPAVTMGWAQIACTVSENGGVYVATYTVSTDDPEDVIPFTIDCQTATGDYVRVLDTSDGSTVHVDFAELGYIALTDMDGDGTVGLWDVVFLTFRARTGREIERSPSVVIAGTTEGASEYGENWTAAHMMVLGDPTGPVTYEVQFAYDNGAQGYVFETGGVRYVLPVDSIPPRNPQITSIVSEDSPFADREVPFSVGLARDDGWGVAGFHVEWTRAADAPSDRERRKNQEATWASSRARSQTATADGNWYLHVATVDHAGNWSDWDTKGPYVIDTVPPGLNCVTVEVNDAVRSYAMPGDEIVIEFVADEELADRPWVIFHTGGTTGAAETRVEAEGHDTQGRTWKATIVVDDLFPEAGLTYEILFDDLAGNRSSYLSDQPGAPTVRVDTTAPSAPPLLAPADGLVTADGNINFAWSAATDEHGGSALARYELELVGPTTSTTPVRLASTSWPLAIGSGKYTWTVWAVDNAGNRAAQPARTLWIDTTPPGVALELAEGQLDPTNESTIRSVVRFTEPITWVDQSKVIASGSACPNSAVAILEVTPNDGTTFEIHVTGMLEEQGDVTVQVRAGAAQDVVGHLSLASAAMTVRYNVYAPVIEVESIASSNAAGDLSKVGDTITVEFAAEAQDPIVDTQVTIGPHAATVASTGANRWSATCVMAQSDPETGDPLAYEIRVWDAAGNLGLLPGSSGIVFDRTAPSVSIAPAGGQADPTGELPIAFVVCFDESVTGFDLNDLELANGQAPAITELAPNDGTEYRVDVHGVTGQGVVLASVRTDAATDRAGNPSQATARSATVEYDSVPPGAPSSLSSTSHETGIWSNDPFVDMEWEGATGADYYLAAWDVAPSGDEIPHTVDPHTYTHPTPLFDGQNHYFYVAVYDAAGNSNTGFDGPYWIDATPPEAPALVCSSHVESVPSNVAGIAYTVTASDPSSGSGIDGYAVAVDENPVWIPAGTANQAADWPGETYTVTASGDWYVHVAAQDIAGNWSAPSTVGPLVIDIAPPTLEVACNSHDPRGAFDPEDPWYDTRDFVLAVTARDGASGVTHYQVAVTSNAAWGPDPGRWIAHAGDLVAETLSRTAASDGALHCHVAVKDAVGNVAINHLGPFRVDTQPPIGLAASSQISTATWGNDNTIPVSWAGADDGTGGSGVVGYSFSWDHTPSGTPDVILDALESESHATTSLPLGDRADHWFHIQACDRAGNWGSVTHLGPFQVDTIPPPAPYETHNRPTIRYDGYDYLGPYHYYWHYTFDWRNVVDVPSPEDGSSSGVAKYYFRWYFGDGHEYVRVDTFLTTAGECSDYVETTRSNYGHITWHPWVRFRVKAVDGAGEAAVDGAGNYSDWSEYWELEGGSYCEGAECD